MAFRKFIGTRIIIKEGMVGGHRKKIKNYSKISHLDN